MRQQKMFEKVVERNIELNTKENKIIIIGINSEKLTQTSTRTAKGAHFILNL